MSDRDVVVRALKRSFERSVEELSGVPFKDTGVSMPRDSIWERYADDVLLALRDREVTSG